MLSGAEESRSCGERDVGGAAASGARRVVPRVSNPGEGSDSPRSNREQNRSRALMSAVECMRPHEFLRVKE